MSAIDPETIDVTQPPAVNPTTSGLRSVVAAIKALFTTAKAEVEGLDSRVTALEEGGGGGATRTRHTEAALNSGDSVVVTHPAVSLDYADEEIDAAAWAEVQGAQDQSTYVHCDQEPYIQFPDLNRSGRTWVRDGTNTGHLSGPADYGVGQACRIRIGGSTYHILEFANDGSGTSDITLSGDPATGAIEYVNGFENIGNSYRLNRVQDTGAVYRCPKDAWHPFVFESSRPGWGEDYPTGNDVAQWAGITVAAPRDQYGFSYPNRYSRWAISPDDGATYYYFDGSAWVEFDGDPTYGAHWAAAPTLPGNPPQGMVAQGNWQEIWDSGASAAMVEADFAEMPTPSGAAAFKVMGATFTDSDDSNRPCGSEFAFAYDEANYRRRLMTSKDAEYMSEGDVELRRKSTTELLVINRSNTDFTNVVVVVTTW